MHSYTDENTATATMCIQSNHQPGVPMMLGTDHPTSQEQQPQPATLRSLPYASLTVNPGYFHVPVPRAMLLTANPSFPSGITPNITLHGTYERPPYSYSALIAMSILSSSKRMLTLSQIYECITEKFPFYKKDEKKVEEFSPPQSLA